jgi:S1-C subfamily serine protease
VLIVDLQRYQIPVNDLPFELLNNARTLNRNDEVYHVGYPNGNPWYVNAKPDMIATKIANVIRFQSDSIALGSSGGGLFNEHGKLIGMVTEDEPPDGRAVTIQTNAEKASQPSGPHR